MGFNIDPSLSGYTPERSTRLAYRDLADNLKSLPGVQSVGLADACVSSKTMSGTAA